jgi:MATE family multidrug resistance protein
MPWTGSKAVIPTENTPLLGPLVPRILEDVDSDAEEPDAMAHHSNGHMYWEEFRILMKYTMPILG